MIKKYSLALYLFRRDLRMCDNTALNAALTESAIVIPCFIFDPRQISEENNYRSTNSIQFMIESLQDLAHDIQKNNGVLYTFSGHAEDIVEQLLTHLSIEALYVNHDYTPFSIARDTALKSVCEKKNRSFFSYADALLHEPQDVKNKAGSPYHVFTPFFKAASALPIKSPQKLVQGNFYTKKIPLPTINLTQELTKHAQILSQKNPYLAIHGGRKNSQIILDNISEFADYRETRDFPKLNTTHLSAYLKFGTHSVREVYATIQKNLGISHPLLRQLFWRDFFTHIAYHYPRVLGHAFNEKFENIPWQNNETLFDLWKNGKTGFPIVDAGMRELVTTGFMHNRVRMIVGSFLVKDLHIDWKKGEQFFAQHLVDYDPAVNNGNWQWVASTGCDAQPYFRIFNPWLQQKKFDPDCAYIKHWIPELKNITTATIHTWYKQKNSINGYPLPCIDHTKESAYSKKIFGSQK